MKSNLGIRLLTMCMLQVVLTATTMAATGTWNSLVAGGSIHYKTTESSTPSKDINGKYVTVVYLENMGFDKIGENSNEADVAWLLSQGYRVIELDYASNIDAVSPKINADIIEINDQLANGSFCGYSNCSKNQSYVLFEGYRISRNIPYFENDPTIYNYSTKVDSLYMDIIYPANASETVPVILSFSYSNSYAGNTHQRLFLGYTLAMFNDSFLEGAPARGIAWAIADHPKYCPWGNGKPVGGSNDTYKSYEVNPDAAQKVKSAVRTLRTLGTDLGLSGKIGIYGFSRGSSAGAMAVGDRVVQELENAGLYISVSDDVQAAALGSGVFDFTQIYNTLNDGDKNLEERCPWIWGALADNYELWNSMGSAYLAETSASAPVLFFYNTDDSHHYQDQIKHFKVKLDDLNVSTSSIINYGAGHSVPQTSASLSQLYNFFDNCLIKGIKDTTNTDFSIIDMVNSTVSNTMQLKLFPNPITNEVQINFNLAKAGTLQIKLYSISGTILYRSEKQYEYFGTKRETLNMDEIGLPQGVYIIKINIDGMQESKKFLKKS